MYAADLRPAFRFGLPASGGRLEEKGLARVKRIIGMMAVLVVVASFSLASSGSVVAPRAKATITNAAIANLDMTWAQQIIEDLSAMGTSGFGFRGAGSASAHEASLYVRDAFTRIGLTDVALERIPLDAWEFRGAYLDVPGLGKLQAASFGGSPGTNGPITATLVDVGNGFASDYVGKDVQGQIVLANWIGDDLWVDSMAKEAQLHGAIAIVVTTYASDYGGTPGSIENHDGLYRPTWPPLLSISGDDGLKIIDLLGKSSEPLVVTAFSDIVITTMAEGGYGWNVVGYLPGRNYGTKEDEFVILGDHTDAWFTGGMDNDSGTAATLVLAGAIKKAYDELGMKPERTIIFTTHEAEEYGILNAYYDWCYGAWYQVTKTHPDWVGRSVAYVNFELMGHAGLPLSINLAPELASFVHNVLAQNNARLPYGFKVTPIPHSWADHWTFTAAGIPGIEVETVDAEWDYLYYHNQFDTIDLIDFGYLGQLFAVYVDMTVRLVTTPIVPYNFAVSANNLATLLKGTNEFGVDAMRPVYARYGLSSADLDRALAAAMDYQTEAADFNAVRGSLSLSQAHALNVELMGIEAVIGQTLIAQGVWEQDWYPYQQSANDLVFLDRGIRTLEAWTPGSDTLTDAIWQLNWVGIIWYYDYMSYENYLDQASRLCGAEVASWGLQTHLLPCVDIWNQYDALNGLARSKHVTTADLAPIIASLKDALRDQAFTELDQSFRTMWAGLEEANAQLAALVASA